MKSTPESSCPGCRLFLLREPWCPFAERNVCPRRRAPAGKSRRPA